MKIATWNVNSLRVRLEHVLDFLATHEIDALALQETKLTDDKFPVDVLARAGYDAVFAGQPTYNGVAILTRRATVGAARSVVRGNPLYPDPQQRLISAEVGGLRLVCAYFPNGQEVGSEKYAYKLAWLDALLAWLQGRGQAATPVPTLLLGDFNIAPEDRDVHDPLAWKGAILCSEPERARFWALLDAGFVDTFRLFEQPERSFSWWDYRQLGFRRNAGLRIDHVLADAELTSRILACRVERAPRKLEQPSDHAPVIVEID